MLKGVLLLAAFITHFSRPAVYPAPTGTPAFCVARLAKALKDATKEAFQGGAIRARMGETDQ